MLRSFGRLAQQGAFKRSTALRFPQTSAPRFAFTRSVPRRGVSHGVTHGNLLVNYSGHFFFFWAYGYAVWECFYKPWCKDFYYWGCRNLPYFFDPESVEPADYDS